MYILQPEIIDLSFCKNPKIELNGWFDMRQASEYVFDDALDGGGGLVCGDGLAFAVDVRDLGYGGADCGEVEEYACADCAREDFDAEKELRTKCGVDGQSDVIDTARERQCSDSGVGT